MTGRIWIGPSELRGGHAPQGSDGYPSIDVVLGGSFQNAAHDESAIAPEQDPHEDEATVKGADLRLGRLEQVLLFEPEKGYLMARGQDAVLRARGVLAAYTKAHGREAAALDNDEQRRMLDDISQRRLARFAEQVQRHDEAERRAWYDEAGDAHIALANADAELYWNDDRLLLRSIGTARAEVSDKAERNGWDAGRTDSALAREMSRTLVAAIRAAAGHDSDRAQALALRHDKDLADSDRAALRGLLEEVRTRRASHEATEAIRQGRPATTTADAESFEPPVNERTGLPTLAWQLDQAEAIADPAVRVATIGRLRSADARAEAAAEERARALGERVLARVMKDRLTDPSQIPISEWISLDVDHQRSLVTLLEYNLKGEQPSPDPELTDQLLTLMIGDRQAFTKLDLIPLVSHLPSTEWQRFRQLQAAIARSDGEAEAHVRAIKHGLTIGERLLRDKFPSAFDRYDGDAEASRAGFSRADYRWALFEEIDAYRRISGGDTDEAALQRIAESTLIELAQSGGRPAIPGDEYHPRSVEDRVKPPYNSNPAHNEKLQPGKTPEPPDARALSQERAVRVDGKTWIARAPNGLYYMYQHDNNRYVHFQGYATIHQLRQWNYDVRQIHRMGPLAIPLRGGGREP